MKTGFEIDWTGIYKPILTVFNGGSLKGKRTRKAKKTSRKARRTRRR